MKKWLPWVLTIVILALISVYAFIPSQIKISNVSLMACTREDVNYCLRDTQHWVRWWPGKRDTGSSYEFKGFRYRLILPLANGADIELSVNHQSYASNILLLPVARDSVGAQWTLSMNSSYNPFKRFSQYFEALDIKENVNLVLDSLKAFASNPENIYSIPVRKEKVQVEFLMSLKKSFTHYPSTPEVYSMIDSVRDFIVSKGLKQLDQPMLSIMSPDSIHFYTEVALPVDKQLPDEGAFSYKWMMKGGNILVSEVTGGTGTVDHAMEQFRNYVSNHQYTVMAIPFQLLITDRSKEPDSSRWITRLYYPVMQN